MDQQTGSEPQTSQGIPPYEPPKAIMRITHKEIVRAIIEDSGSWFDDQNEMNLPDEFPIFWTDWDRQMFISDTLGARDFEEQTGGKRIGIYKDIRIRLEREPRLRELLRKTREENDRIYAERRAHNDAQAELSRVLRLKQNAAVDLYDAACSILNAVDLPHIGGRFTPANEQALWMGIDALRVAVAKANGETVPQETSS